MAVRDIDPSVGDAVADAARGFGRLLADLRFCLERHPHELQDRAGGPLRSIATGALASVGRGERLVEQLLSYTGQSVLVAADVELLPMLSSLAEVLRNTLDARIGVSVRVERDCPPCRADAGALEDALLNLVVNARDAMQHAGGSLSLSARVVRLADDSPVVEIGVSDSVVRLAHDIAQPAADRFSIRTIDDDPMAGMAGLRLAAVDSFVKQSQGDLILETVAGTGTRACLRLPAVLPLEQRADTGRTVR